MSKSGILFIISFSLACLVIYAFSGPGTGSPVEGISIQHSPDAYPANESGCLTSGCHEGIAPIRQHDSKMQRIFMNWAMNLTIPMAVLFAIWGMQKPGIRTWPIKT